MAKAQRTLREFTTPDSIFVDFPSLSDFDDIYSCDTCTNTHLCSIFAEVEASLQVDIFPSYEVVDTILYAVEALDIQVA